MRALPSSVLGVLVSMAGAALLFLVALVAPERTMLVLPLLVLIMVALALYQFPIAFVAAFVLVYGLAVDIQLDVLAQMGAAPGGEKAATIGAAVLKVVPFVLTASLILRYGFSSAINWPFIAFGAIAAASIAILPMGRVIDTPEMVRSFIGSAAPFALGFARAPHRVWQALVRGAAVIPIISAVFGLMNIVVDFYPAFDRIGRFQGLHSPPFLAGLCSTAIFAAVLEYLRGFRKRWLLVAALDLVVLLATQARAPLGAVLLFLLIVFIVSGRKVFPLQRKVDLVMVGVVPALVLLAPFAVMVMDRFVGEGGGINFSGRDLILPYFTEAIANRPFFGYGLGAGKLIVDPEDPLIRLLGSNAAHNEYLRLSVDAGVIGCAAIFLSIIAWIWIGTREVPQTDKLVLRAALAAVLLHSGFDNTLIATTGVMQFTFFAAAMARGRLEWRVAEGRGVRHARRSKGESGRVRGGRPGPGGEAGQRPADGLAAASGSARRGGTAFPA